MVVHGTSEIGGTQGACHKNVIPMDPPPLVACLFGTPIP